MRRLFIVIGVVALALAARLWAVRSLPAFDADEPAYMQAASEYAVRMLDGRWSEIPNFRGNYEHPALIKLTYGVGIAVTEKVAGTMDYTVTLFVVRGMSAVYGTLGVLLLALLNPIAGGLLAIHTLAIKYASEAYLEAGPMTASLAAMMTFARSRSARDKWFWLSALALGATAASKYTYLPAAVTAILYLGLLDHKRPVREIAIYFAATTVFFFTLNPVLWPDPVGRLRESLGYHADFSGSEFVRSQARPWFQPFVYLSQPVTEHPEVFFSLGYDHIILALGLLGLPKQWKERRWIVVWIAAGAAALLAWPAKWPQYPLIVVPAICLSAGDFVTETIRSIRVGLYSAPVKMLQVEFAFFSETLPPLVQMCLRFGIPDPRSSGRGDARIFRLRATDEEVTARWRS